MSYTSIRQLDGTLRSDVVSRDGDGKFVAASTADCPEWMAEDAAAYQAWLTAGNQPTVPPLSPAPPRVQLGGTFLAAIVDLGWWSWFDQGAAAQVAGGKPLDGRYWLSIGKADLVLVTDAKLTRVARAAEAARVAASGKPAPAQPLISMTAVMDHGDAMTAAASR